MHKFIGTKVVYAKPMSRKEYNAYRGWVTPDNENPEDEGYLVEYAVVEGTKQNKNHPDHDNYISWSPKDVFEASYKPALIEHISKPESMPKTLDNTTANKAIEQVSDIKFWGDGDTFKLISKASSKQEDWMKSTKVMEIEGLGCVIQITTQQGSHVAEAAVFVPGTRVETKTDEGGKVIARKIVKI